MVKNLPLTRHNMDSYSQCTLGADYISQYWVEPVWQMNDSDSRVTRDDWHGDRCIGSHGSVHILDQQWILSVSWGDGFAIRRINDDGTITRVSSDTHPNGYNHNTSLAYHPGTRQAVVSQYNTSRVGVIDLGPWIDAGKPDDGAGITYIKNIYQKDSTWNFPTDRVGTSYECGLKFAGDWLYMASYSRDTLNGEVYRWNIITREYEKVKLANNTYNSQHWEGSFIYDDRLDRMFYQVRWSGGLNIIDNASTSSPTGYMVKYSGNSKGSNHCTYKGVVYKDGNPNTILVGGDWRFFLLDISDVSPTNPTPVFLQDTYAYSYGFRQYYPFGSEDPYMEDEYRGGNPYKDKFIPIRSDRGWLRKGGWFDIENFKAVGRNGENDYSQHRDTYFTDYMGGTFKVTSANGTDYYLGCGYGWDGNRISVFNAPYLPKTEYQVIFGGSDKSFNNNENITAVDLTNGYEVNSQTNTNVSVEVSNNNGSTWEVYQGGIHTFTSTGYQFKVKYVFTGHEYAMPYLYAKTIPMALILAPGYEHASNSKTLNYKISGI